MQHQSVSFNKAIIYGVFTEVIAYFLFTIIVLTLFEPSFSDDAIIYKSKAQLLHTIQSLGNVLFTFLPGLASGFIYGKKGFVIGATAGLCSVLVAAIFLLPFLDSIPLESWLQWVYTIVGSGVAGFFAASIKSKLMT